MTSDPPLMHKLRAESWQLSWFPWLPSAAMMMPKQKPEDSEIFLCDQIIGNLKRRCIVHLTYLSCVFSFSWPCGWISRRPSEDSPSLFLGWWSSQLHSCDSGEITWWPNSSYMSWAITILGDGVSREPCACFISRHMLCFSQRNSRAQALLESLLLHVGPWLWVSGSAQGHRGGNANLAPTSILLASPPSDLGTLNL